MMNKLISNAKARELKASAQRLKPMLRIGKEGVTDAFLKSVDNALDLHELVKIKFTAHKERRRELSPFVADQTNSFLVMQVGHAMVLYRAVVDNPRRKPDGGD